MDLQEFNFNGQEVRTVMRNNTPYFIGKDVAEALGYRRPTKAIADHIDDEDKDEVPIQDSIGRSQMTPIINESGLYSLILKSNLDTAKRFNVGSHRKYCLLSENVAYTQRMNCWTIQIYLFKWLLS